MQLSRFGRHVFRRWRVIDSLEGKACLYVDRRLDKLNEPLGLLEAFKRTRYTCVFACTVHMLLMRAISALTCAPACAGRFNAFGLRLARRRAAAAAVACSTKYTVRF